MATIITFNDNTTPHSLQGTVGKEVFLGTGNLMGVPTMSEVLYPPKPIQAIPETVQPLVNQILGLVPFLPCVDSECRTYSESEYINIVLGHLTETDLYYNDTSTFLISFNAWYSLLYSTTIYLQEYAGGTWSNIATLNDNTYGTYIPFNTYPLQPSITGFIVKWRNVLSAFGEGIYRIRITGVGAKVNECGVSVPFCLKEYSCTNAMNTVKFEITLTSGLIGHHSNPAVLVNLCNITYTDSIRFEGFFGYEKADYERKNVEYNNGIIYKVRDEVIKKYDLQTGRLPKWLHDRFSAYALMADTILVSDYNYNNPDYGLKRKGVICDSGYEPVWVQNSRKARVKVSFKENQQNLIRKRCCDGRK